MPIVAPAISVETTNGVTDAVTSEILDGGVRLVVYVSEAELIADVAQYDPSQGASPSVTICRKYVRKMFDAYNANRVAAGLDPIPYVP